MLLDQPRNMVDTEFDPPPSPKGPGGAGRRWRILGNFRTEPDLEVSKPLIGHYFFLRIPFLEPYAPRYSR